jgi:prepilin-type N-terminal cleavage/methylation domain-containing protein/prepilin-type processing-associated H-X9-DG protein
MKRAFTLVELLVVVAILSLLMSLLLPALKKAKDLARDAVCGANMDAICTAELMYASDNRQHLTRAATGDPRPDGEDVLVDVHPWEQGRGVLWYETLFWEQYIGGLNVYDDPVDKNPRVDDSLPDTELVSYATNAFLERGGMETRIDKVKAAAWTIMVAPDNPAGNTGSGLWSYARPDAHRHAGYRAPYAFCDGHVEFKTFKEMFEVEYDPEASYADMWSTARPELTTVWQNGWSADSLAEEFPHWSPWGLGAEYDQWGHRQ